MQVSNLFTENLRLLRYGQRRIVNQGGQNSGKTVNILGVLATMSSEEEGSNAGTTTVTSMSFPHLRGGALRDFEQYVYPSFKGAISKYHKTDHIFTFNSGSIIEFKTFENEMTARGPKRKRLFCNEANSMDEMLFFQLDSRSDQTIIDYNPSIRFFAHEKLIGEQGNALIISDHRHNPFLTESKHREIENLCTFAYAKYDEAGNGIGARLVNEKTGNPIILKGDYELWKVYARGLTGNVEGLIFNNWEVINDEDFPSEDPVFSIDFGYTIDPTVIIKQCKIGDTLFVHELGYETGMPARDIVAVLRSNGYNDRTPLYCEHDADMIRQIRKAGCTYAQVARKGQGSVNAGIEQLRKLKVKYTSSSRNIKTELGKYIWTKDKATGKWINIPVDLNNHAMDAIRYGAYSHFLKTT
jgi:phage terminase large subunit